MRKQRKAEASEERRERLKKDAQRKIDESAAADAAVDQMIRQNIKLYGP